MATEQLANLYQTTVASGGYTAGSLVLNVTSAIGAPTIGPFTVTILNSAGTAIILLFRVTSVSGTAFTGAAEGTDTNAAAGSLVIGTTLSVAAITNLFANSGVTFTEVYGDSFTVPLTANFPTAIASPQATSVVFNNTSNPGVSGLILSANCSANDTNIVAQLYAVPSTPYGIRIRFWATAIYNQYQFDGGLALYASGSGAFIIFGLFSRGTGSELRIAQYNNTTSFNTSPLEAFTWGVPGRAGLVDLYIHDDGSTRNYYIIGDGSLSDKVLVHSEANGTFLAPTHVGMFVAPGDNSPPVSIAQISVVDWTQTT